MKLYLDQHTYINTSEPLDISIQLYSNGNNLTAWYVDQPKFSPVEGDGFIGAVKQGGSVNFRNIFFNPHGHCTHTECLGHITDDVYSVNDSLKEFFFKAVVLTIEPRKFYNEEFEQEDLVIYADQLKSDLLNEEIDALVIRTLPNGQEKKHKNYSSANPPYLDLSCVDVLNEFGIKHFLIDQPSVDREIDKGALSFHHAFWNVPENPEFFKTITEFVYVDDSIADGKYLLELQMAAFQNDAAPSRPVLYRLYQN